MEETLLNQFRQLVLLRTGLCITERDGAKFAKKIVARATSRKAADLEQYYRFLEGESFESQIEWEELTAQLTVGETYFLRDKGQFALLQHRVLPELIERNRRQRSLRIWSAGCSGGEEPYSLAILVNEALPDPEGWTILILGSDINRQAIEKAQEGVYSQWSFRTVDPAIQNRYFRRKGNEWELDTRIRRMVTFRHTNLVSDAIPDPGSDLCQIDLILCRNVFIYFDRDTVALVLDKLAQTLNVGGYLVPGHSEIQGQYLGRLLPRVLPESVIYQKCDSTPVVPPPSKEEATQRPATDPLRRAAAAASQPPVRKSDQEDHPSALPVSGPAGTTPDPALGGRRAPEMPDADPRSLHAVIRNPKTVISQLQSFLSDSAAPEANGSTGSTRRRDRRPGIVPERLQPSGAPFQAAPSPARPTGAEPASQRAPTEERKELQESQLLLGEAEEYFLAGEYRETILKLDHLLWREPRHVGALSLMARAYANLGEHDAAIRHCRQLFEIDPLSVDPYYLMAHIAEERGNQEEAQAFFKKVIYLSPDFAPAYLDLGALYDRRGDPRSARQMRKAALEFLTNLPPGAVVEAYGNTTAGELTAYVQKMVDE